MGITLLTTQGSCLQEGAQPGKDSQNSSPAKGQGRGQGQQHQTLPLFSPVSFPPVFFFLFIYYFKIWFLGEMPAIFLKDLPMCVPKWELCGLKWICFSNLANNREQIPHDLRCILTVRSCIFFLLQSQQIIKHFFFLSLKLSIYW